MSQQSSDMGEPEESHAGHHKKRTGEWKLYMRYLAKDGLARLFPGWSKVRSYETEEMAQKARKLMDRKWNSGRQEPAWEFIVALEKPKD